MTISSSSNPKVKDTLKLIQNRKTREETGLFVCEGIRLFHEIPRDRICRIFLSESFLHRPEAREILSPYRAAGQDDGSHSARESGSRSTRESGNESGNHGRQTQTEVFVLTDSVFKSLSDTRSPQGILAVVRRRDWTLDEILDLPGTPFYMMAENLQDPGNLGTIMRTGEGAGITGLILSRGTVDIYSPKVIRSTMGSLFRVPFLYTDDLSGVIRQMQERGISVYAAHLEGSVPYDTPDYRRASALLIGNEGNGLTDEVSRAAVARIRIPMGGKLESLNAAVSAAVLMYEVRRQRGNQAV
ncbi:MAG: RNA methyltransferase [Lachnospiraceae bacterium]|nr:RNA methyltransferase [Lachnospiraceae bacterium]